MTLALLQRHHVAHTRHAESLRRVTTLERAHDPPAAPGLRALDEKARQRLEVLVLERERAERIARQRIEARRDESRDRARSPSSPRRSRRRSASTYVARRKVGAHRDIPHVAVRTAIVGGAGAGIPRPLVHRDEVDVALVLDERLRAVAMMDVPVDDEHALRAVTSRA